MILSGAESGVQFVLNVEEYEHVQGYVAGIGVKVTILRLLIFLLSCTHHLSVLFICMSWELC